MDNAALEAAVNQVIQVLTATLSVDNETRKTAEQELKRLASVQGLGSYLLQIAMNGQVSAEIRLAASLALKNFVRENWSGEGDAPLPPEEKDQLRNNLLRSMFEVPSSYRRQISQTVCLIGRHDFPDNWPQLIDVVAGNLSISTGFDKLVAALSTLEELVKRYRHEMKSDKLWLEIIFVLQKVADPLTQLFCKMREFTPQEGAVTDPLSHDERLAWLEVLHSITNIYLSLVSQDIPEYFEDNLRPWMEGFLELLRLHLPGVEAITDDCEASLLDKLKHAICEILTLFSQRYEECFHQYTEGFIAAAWKLLTLTDHRIRFDSLVNAALGFLSAICQRPQYVRYFEDEGVLKTICESVIVQNLLLREEDTDMYEQEPFDFLRRDIEGSDLETRRRGASDFVRALCKLFEPRVYAILSAAIQQFLADYASNPRGNYKKMDVVYCLVSAIASKTTTARYGTTSTSQLINVSDFFERQVRGDLLDGGVDDVPILRSDALKFLVLFRNQLRPAFLIQSMSGRSESGVMGSSIIRLLESNNVILHHYVAYTVDRLLLVKNPQGQPLLSASNVPIREWIDALFNCFQRGSSATSTHYIVKALMRCFSAIDDETAAANSQHYIERLKAMIEQCIRQPPNPQFVHFMFEALCVLIRRSYNRAPLDLHVISIVELIIPKDVVDFVPYALQVVALLLDLSSAANRDFQQHYLGFFPFLLKGDFWSRSANLPALLLVLESYINSYPQQVFGADYVDQVKGCYQHLIGSKAKDQHGFRLANAMLPYADSVEKLTSRDLLLPMLNRMNAAKTTKFTRGFVLFLCRYSAVKGGSRLSYTLDSIQPGLYAMVIERILLPELKGMPQTTTYEEKRIVAIGVASLVGETFNALGTLYSSLIEFTVDVLEAFEHRKHHPGGEHHNGEDASTTASQVGSARTSTGGGANVSATGVEDEDPYVEGNELEYSDPYCKLSYAQHVDQVGKAVKDVKAHLAEVVERVRETSPQSVDCLTPRAQNVLRSYLSSPSSNA